MGRHRSPAFPLLSRAEQPRMVLAEMPGRYPTPSPTAKRRCASNPPMPSAIRTSAGPWRRCLAGCPMRSATLRRLCASDRTLPRRIPTSAMPSRRRPAGYPTPSRITRSLAPQARLFEAHCNLAITLAQMPADARGHRALRRGFASQAGLCCAQANFAMALMHTPGRCPRPSRTTKRLCASSRIWSIHASIWRQPMPHRAGDARSTNWKSRPTQPASAAIRENLEPLPRGCDRDNILNR